MGLLVITDVVLTLLARRFEKGGKYAVDGDGNGKAVEAHKDLVLPGEREVATVFVSV